MATEKANQKEQNDSTGNSNQEKNRHDKKSSKFPWGVLFFIIGLVFGGFVVWSFWPKNEANGQDTETVVVDTLKAPQQDTTMSNLNPMQIVYIDVCDTSTIALDKAKEDFFRADKIAYNAYTVAVSSKSMAKYLKKYANNPAYTDYQKKRAQLGAVCPKILRDPSH